ncbi:TnpV protein [Petrocella atlantisensis]|uniref:TnpV protein n=1 Tax=Petrocella atlantisensis TaxID=2173034 RepID=UPI0038CD1512
MLVPNIELTNKAQNPVEIYGRARKRYLEENKPAQYSAMIIQGTLQSHLQEVEIQAERLLEMQTPQLQEAWEVTEQMKATDPMKWVGMMNNIKSTIEETIYSEIVYK